MNPYSEIEEKNYIFVNPINHLKSLKKSVETHNLVYVSFGTFLNDHKEIILDILHSIVDVFPNLKVLYSCGGNKDTSHFLK